MSRVNELFALVVKAAWARDERLLGILILQYQSEAEKRADTTHTDADLERAVRAALEAAAGFLEGQTGYDSVDGEHPLVAAIRAIDPAEIVRAAREGGE